MFPTVRQLRGVVIGRHVVHLYAHGKCAPSELVRRLWWGAAALPFGQGLGLKGSPLRRTSVSSVTAQLGAILRPGNHRIVTS